MMASVNLLGCIDVIESLFIESRLDTNEMRALSSLEDVGVVSAEVGSVAAGAEVRGVHGQLIAWR